MNINNNLSVIGRIANVPYIINEKDETKKTMIRVTLISPRYSQNDTKGYMHQITMFGANADRFLATTNIGDRIRIIYNLESQTFQDKNTGQTRFATRKVCEIWAYAESMADKEDRLARKAEQSMQQAQGQM